MKAVHRVSMNGSGRSVRHVVNGAQAGVRITRAAGGERFSQGHMGAPLRHIVSSASTEAPGAKLLGMHLGEPYTDPSSWEPDGARHELEPEALRFAWEVRGQPLRVAIAVEWIACGVASCRICGGLRYIHGPFVYEYRRRRGGRGDARDVERVAMARGLARRSPPPTLDDALEMLAAWRLLHEDARAGARYRDEERRREREAEELERERLEGVAAALEAFDLAEPFNAREVQRAHRKLAKRHHPDRGGDPAKMIAANQARDRLLEELRRRQMGEGA